MVDIREVQVVVSMVVVVVVEPQVGRKGVLEDWGQVQVVLHSDPLQDKLFSYHSWAQL